MATIKIQHHPDYLSSINKWREIDDFRDGDTDRVKSYLIPFESESGNTEQAQAKRRERLNRLQNENDIAPIAEVHLSHLAQPINFGDVAKQDALKVIIEDADGEGTSQQKMLRTILSDFIDHGKVGVLVDGTEATAETKEAAAEAGERSYQIPFKAEQIRYWSKFKRGKRRGQFKEIILDAEPGIDVDGKAHARLQRFYMPDELEDTKFIKEILETEDPKDEISATKGEIELAVAETAGGTLNYIPFFQLGAGLLDSVMRMPAQMSKGLLNDRSQRDNIHLYQAHQRLVGTGVAPEDVKAAAEYNVMCLPNPDASINTIEAGDPASLTQKIKDKELKIKRYGMKRLNELVSDSSAQVQSADSKSLDQKALIAWYNEVLDEAQKFLNKIYACHAEYEGVKVEPAITIPRDFGLDDPEAERLDRTSIFSKAQALGVPEVQKQILKQELSELKTIIPNDGETGEAAKERLKKAIDAAAGNSGLLNERLPSIAEQI